ncbi:glycosyltransferase family 2 protein [Raoultella ornithinolytica]|uniref:glycosyltransferase family 2 protein n=1 Tax=Raoultella ornithinolytica TaxID=54291 RepID=UPI0021A89656|nr:glycosyltransferase family 2 protein [Raoultella ornithinolytica]MCT1682164.1 glycosyltransferase family 2 protein [Raoultella ornithinolytica]MEB8213832.1 glycosyltransferase family 2 protein [Raoultella ornithinolytica]HEC2597219.1 glycosyltransferase family 2 protein [Raoultella ornithinolytica]
MKKIQVLLATYNGQDYIIDQIESILLNFERAPNYHCEILISDDASTDSTIQTIKNKFSSCANIKILSDERKGGVRNNFTYLINSANADLIFFCDQDDFWLPNKFSKFIDNFYDHNGNDLHGDVPVLVHSDLCVVDKYLSPINASMFNYQKLNPDPTFSNLIVSNSITGCVTAINHSLLEILKSSSINNSIMHDWYIGLIAKAMGKVIFLPNSFILYRQHGNNQVGAKKIGFKNLFDFEKFKEALSSIRATKEQAKLFLADFSDSIDSKTSGIANDYVLSFQKSFVFRLRLFLKYGIVKYGFVRNAVFFILYVFFGRSI